MTHRALVLARDPERAVLPDAAMLCDLYRLTPAEAAVTLAAAEGATADEIALLREVSPNTVRTQLKAAMARMGCANLRQMTRVLTGLGG